MAGHKGRPSSIRIRMYRIGFGDCFLVTFPGPLHVLVDCGVHNRGNIGTLDRVLEDIEQESGGRLALVIASHAHEDHIAGFIRGQERFRSFSIGEVWLPWSEDRSDELARRLRQSQARLQFALEQHFKASPDAGEAVDLLANASAKRNEPALASLRDGLGGGGQVAFLRAGETRLEPGGVPGLSARILGPPRDEAFLRRMDPPKAERYLRATDDGTVEEGVLRPFDSPVLPEDDPGPRLTERQRRALQAAVELTPEALAFALDRAINNTSIVALFSYRGVSLLFAGDSQYGGWKSWLDLPDAAAELGRLSFYKVAHHGSENATPRTALEGMPTDKFAAMISTQSVPWPSIPYGKLMDALERQTGGRVLRSDSVKVADAPEGPLVSQLPEGFDIGPFWVDYHIAL